MGNINQENKSIINLHIFKFWTLENIVESQYQEFILNLLKINLVNHLNGNISSIEKDHAELIESLKKEGFDFIENKINNENKNENKIFY